VRAKNGAVSDSVLEVGGRKICAASKPQRSARHQRILWGATMTMNINALAAALGGDVVGRQVKAPGPGHSPQDRSLSVQFNSADQFVVHSFAGDDPLVCKDYVRSFVLRTSHRKNEIPAPRVWPGGRTLRALEGATNECASHQLPAPRLQ
jgi:hypothetical protein